VAEPVLRIEGLTYRYPEAGKSALVDVDLEVGSGEFVLLAGRSASGKTTLLRAACGLVPHFHGGEISGRLEVTGLDVRDCGPGELAESVGFVAQDPETQVVSTTVRAELELPLELRGEPPSARGRAVEEVALALGIAPLLDRSTHALSGGELQRVALAAALVGRPRLVLLDEPTSQLDPVAGDELIGLLRRLNEQWGTAVLLCEHRVERCLDATDRAVALDRGRIAFDGAPASYLEWALERDPPLATPAARLFHLAGLRPLPVGVKRARAALATSGRLPPAVAQTTARPASPPGAPALRLGGVRVDLDAGEGPREVLRGIDLEIRAGERIALMGRNGAGKSTLLRACAGLVAASRGRVEVPAGCALLTQSPGDFLVHERVADELRGPQASEALDAAGLAGASERNPRDLSGGERQRLALAIVMAGRRTPPHPAGGDESRPRQPGLLCLDEPTRGMDRARKDELAGRLEALGDAGIAVVVATHDVEFAAGFCERVVLLGDGAVVADGPREEILAGGWYFATEVARILDGTGAVSPEEGAALLSSPTALLSETRAVRA
jgi:energy-coupling factor transport system ATP-binding protein